MFIGAYHVCEHLNKLMKVLAGRVGISNNANARQRFFMAAPELSCLSKDFKSKFDVGAGKVTEHHDLGPSTFKRGHDAINNAYIPNEYVPQVLNIDAIGQKLYDEYVSKRINGYVSLWPPEKKQNNKMYLSGNKKGVTRL